MTLRKNLQMMLTVTLLVLAVLSLHWQESLLSGNAEKSPLEQTEEPVASYVERKVVPNQPQHFKPLTEKRVNHKG